MIAKTETVVNMRPNPGRWYAIIARSTRKDEKMSTKEKYKKVKVYIQIVTCMVVGSALMMIPYSFHAFEVAITQIDKIPDILLVTALWLAAMLLFLWAATRLETEKKYLEKKILEETEKKEERYI